MNRILVSSLLLFSFAGPVEAACSCRCVDGEVRQLCTSTFDPPVICAPRICPIASPSIEPIMPPTLPPLGTTSCRMARVWNGFAYVWQRVCG